MYNDHKALPESLDQMFVSNCFCEAATINGEMVRTFRIFFTTRCLLSFVTHVTKLLYNYINSQKTCRDSIKGLMDPDGTYQTDGRIIANLLDDHFSSVFTVISAEPIPTLTLSTNVKCLVEMDVFPPDSIKKYIERLNTHMSPGLDSVYPFVVKS